MSLATDPDAARLPPLIRDMAECIGLEAALKVATYRPGRRCYFPATPGADHPIAQLIGHSAALRLCTVYGGDYLHMPSLRRYENAKRNRAICQALANGTATAAQLARRYGLREDSVYAIKREAAA